MGWLSSPASRGAACAVVSVVERRSRPHRRRGSLGDDGEALATHDNNQDLDALVQLFDLDGTLVPEPGVALTGASLRDGLAGLLQLGGTMSVQILDAVTVGDLALTRTAWSVDTPASLRTGRRLGRRGRPTTG